MGLGLGLLEQAYPITRKTTNAATSSATYLAPFSRSLCPDPRNVTSRAPSSDGPSVQAIGEMCENHAQPPSIHVAIHDAVG